MKRLIVLATLVTLLASASGCSMFNRMGAQPCETCDPTSSAPLLSRLRLPSISLPWRRAANFSKGSGECNSTNEGFSEPSGFSELGVGNAYPTGTVIGGQVIDGQVIDGQVIDGVIIGDSYQGAATSGAPTLYHPEVVGPVSTPSYATRYAGELIPAPVSPAVDLGK